jgi:hypothetical protein
MLPRTLTAGFIPPCLPSKATEPPTGAAWLHEIKHDGFRIIARKDGSRVRLYSRPGNDFTGRFPLIVEALAWLGARSCIIDGEAVACGGDGVPSFDRIRYRRHDASVFLYAFDLIALDGGDLRREPLEVRKATLASVLAKAARGLRFGGVPRLTARTTPRSPSSRRACTSRRSTEPMPRWRRIGAFCRPQLSFTGGCLARTTNAPSTAFWMFETNSLLRDTTASTSPLDVLKTSTYNRRGQIN